MKTLTVKRFGSFTELKIRLKKIGWPSVSHIVMSPAMHAKFYSMLIKPQESKYISAYRQRKAEERKKNPLGKPALYSPQDCYMCYGVLVINMKNESM